MRNVKPLLLALLLGIPAIASAHSPIEVAHERHWVVIKKMHYGNAYGDRHRYAPRHYDGWGDGRINALQWRQQEAIKKGLRSGDLTRREADRLWQEQERIARLESRYKADGHFSARERRDLERDLNRAGHRIYNERHDRQYRG